MTHQIENMKQHKVIISGGGSGGHIFPAIAIAKSLLELDKNIDLLFVGASDKMEMEKVPAAGFKIIGLWISGFHRKNILRNLLFPLKLLYSIVKSFFIILKFQPNLVIGTGGFASGPILFVASLFKIPTLIQEQNSYAGITNKLLAKYVDKICVAYDDMHRFFPQNKIIKTGNPIRRNIIENTTSLEKAKNDFKIDNNNLTVLVVGGSLGARTINTSILNSLSLFKQEKLNLIWQTGQHFSAVAVNAVKEFEKDGISTFSFIKNIENAYKAADIIISRAGAIAISELCVIGKPVILIPSPNVAENHQFKNAQSLVNKNAALLVKDSQANDKLVLKIISLKNDIQLMKELSVNIKNMEAKEASSIIAAHAMSLIK